MLELCDWVTVLRDGVRTADQPLAGSDPAALVRLMVGRDPGDLFPRWERHSSETVALSARGLVAEGVAGVDLEVRYGEVLGLGGLLGQGQEETLLALYGDLPRRGEVVIDGARAPRARPCGRTGAASRTCRPTASARPCCCLCRSASTSCCPRCAGSRAAASGVSMPRSRSAARSIREFGIRTGDPSRSTQFLSGGNQQKVAIARWLPLRPRIFLLNDPTRGVDVETKREIYQRLRQMAADGAAVVLLSSDTLELVHACDRVAVFREGRVALILERADLSEEAIVAASLGLTGQPARLAS